MVLCLMYFMYPIAYPTALLLDYFLGESHGTVYKKAGLKTLVSLHQSVNSSDVDALTEDEVTIIGAVLDLRSKPVSQIMTPIDDVFTLSTDDTLDEKVVDKVYIGNGKNEFLISFFRFLLRVILVFPFMHQRIASTLWACCLQKS